MKLFVQNNSKNFEFASLDLEEIKQIHEHIEHCELCSEAHQNYLHIYKEIESVAVTTFKRPTKTLLTIAATLLIVLTLPYMNQAHLNENQFVMLHEFEFKIKRGNTIQQDSASNRIIYLINEKKYDEALMLCDKLELKQDHMYRFASTLLKGQAEKDEELIKKSLLSIPTENKALWETRVNAILSNN